MKLIIRTHRFYEAGLAPYEATIERAKPESDHICDRLVAKVYDEELSDRIMRMDRVDRALIIAGRALLVTLQNANNLLTDGHIAGIRHALEVIEDAGFPATKDGAS